VQEPPAATGAVQPFTTVNGCTAPVAAGGSCTVAVSFAPTTTGAKSATVTIASNDPATPTTSVAVSGTGIAQVAPGAVTFPAAPSVLGTSATVPIAAPANPPGAPVLGLTAQIVNANTATTVGAAIPLGPGATSVVTGPLPAGDYQVNIFATNVVGNGPTSTSAKFSIITAPTAPPVIGTATLGTGQATITWTPVADTLANNGNSTITGYSVQRVTAAGVAVGAPVPVPGQGSSTFTLTGLAAGTTLAFKVAAVNAVGTGPFSAQSNTVTVPGVALTPASLTFAGQNVGTVSAIQVITVRNTTAATIAVNSVVLGGTNANQFTTVTTCIRNLAANAACLIGVRVTPTVASGAGLRTATLTVSSPTAGSAVATLSGTALTPATITTVNTVNFGARPNGTTTTTTLTVNNTGTGPLNISSVTTGGSTTFSFALGTCSLTTPVPPGGSCALNVTFKPVVNATVTGTLSIVSNASNGTRTVNLTGR